MSRYFINAPRCSFRGNDDIVHNFQFAILGFVVICSLLLVFHASSIADEDDAGTPTPSKSNAGLSDDSSPKHLLDPGLDPYLEKKRRMRAIGHLGISVSLSIFLLSAAGVWWMHGRGRKRALAPFLLVSSLALCCFVAEAALRLSIESWAVHVKIRSNCYHSNPRGYFKLSRMKDRPEVAAYCVDRLEEVWAECDRPTREADGPRFRILALGDSFTDGVGVFRRDTWPAKLQAVLAGQEGRRRLPAVVNCGRSDFNVIQIARRYQSRRERHDPHVVIYAYTLNDPPIIYKSGGGKPADISFQWENSFDYERRIRQNPILEALIHHSALVRFFAERLIGKWIAEATEGMYKSIYADPHNPGLHKTFEAIQSINDDCRRRGRRFLAAIFPLFNRFDPYPFRQAHETLSRELRRRNIAVIDLLPLFDGRKAERFQVHPTDFHPNEIAHRMAAKAIAAELDRLGWDGIGPEE